MVLEHSQTPEQVLGQYLRNLRLNRGWTLMELANKAGISDSFLSRVEYGKQGISIKVLCKLARAFSVSPCEILTKSGYVELSLY